MTQTTSPSSNIFLFYGEDDFSLKRKIDRWKEEFAKKYSRESISVFDAENLSEDDVIKNLQSQLAPSLFTQKKLIIARDVLPKKSEQEKLCEFLLQLPD